MWDWLNKFVFRRSYEQIDQHTCMINIEKILLILSKAEKLPSTPDDLTLKALKIIQVNERFFEQNRSIVYLTDEKSFEDIVKYTIEDGIINMTRLAAILAFAGQVCQHNILMLQPCVIVIDKYFESILT